MLKKSILLFLLLTALSCKNDIEVKPKETQQRIKVSSLEREPYLKEVLDRVGFVSSKNGRVNGDMAINTDAIIMTLQKDDRSYCYTFAIENRTTATTFTNLIFKRVVGGVKAFYLKYESENLYPFNLSHFTGKITSYDLGFNEITVQYFSKGNLSSPKSGRVQGCQPSVEVKRECLTQDGKSTTTGTDLPCLYGTTHVIYLDYSGCLITDGIGVAGGNLPSQYTQWSNGTFVPTQWFNDGGPGGGPGGGGSGSCGGNGVTTPSSGTDPNFCGDNIGVSPPTLTVQQVLKFFVDSNPYLLTQIPCDQIPKWQVLTQHKPNQAILDKLSMIKSKYPLSDVAWQSIENASGNVVNLDYFPVTVTTLPKNPTTGQRFTAPEFLNYIRTHMDEFVDTSITSFSPSPITETGYDEAQIWNSNNPFGGVIHLDIALPGGDGTVICTDFHQSKWIFSTINVPYRLFKQGYDGEHPVSGNREFGFSENANAVIHFILEG